MECPICFESVSNGVTIMRCYTCSNRVCGDCYFKHYLACCRSDRSMRCPMCNAYPYETFEYIYLFQLGGIPDGDHPPTVVSTSSNETNVFKSCWRGIRCCITKFKLMIDSY